MQEIDPRFKAAKAKSEKRRRRGPPWGLIGGGVFGILVIGAGVWAVMSGLLGDLIPGAGDQAELAEDTDSGSYVSPFIDLAGDPLVLRLSSGSGAQTTLFAPPELDGDRVTGDIVLISDVMIAREDALITTVPTSREDFAFFQSQRSLNVDQGEDVVSGQASTSLRLTPEHLRPLGTDEVVMKLTTRQPGLSDALAGNGLAAADLVQFETALSEAFDVTTSLAPGAVVAVRYIPDGIDRLPVQVSVYGSDGYLASAANDDTGEAVTLAADPWVDENLSLRGRRPAEGTSSQQYRLLDAVYSTGLRNGMPSALLGEAIVLLSRAFDTDAFALPGDRLTLVYSTGSAYGPAGQILYASIDRTRGEPLKCYVAGGGQEPELRCWGPTASGQQASGPRLRPGMSPPVAGIMRAGFGPRNDPDTGKVEVHPGVDWAAPKGSEVRTAQPGKVLSIGDDPRYGLTVEVEHDKGRSTFYAHLDSVADIAVGKRLTPGAVIGTVGTSGDTNVPHLHFELRKNGNPQDPYIHDAGGLAGEAVRQLVDQIIKVESGSTPENAAQRCAANPNSTAVGPGQFIKSTWVRMMKNYRADLYASLNREELLKLRCDYTLSYEMVTNLAKEGEAYIVRRGHDVTAGRLYLAHFLGAGAAADVLGAGPDVPLKDVVSKGVFKANQFLVRKGIDTPAEIEEWAEKKMRGRGGKSGPPPPPAEVAAYMRLIDGLLAGG